jgi:hypothetical protein
MQIIALLGTRPSTHSVQDSHIQIHSQIPGGAHGNSSKHPHPVAFICYPLTKEVGDAGFNNSIDYERIHRPEQ